MAEADLGFRQPFDDVEWLRGEIAGLQDALASRTVIAQAVGMIMERYKISDEHAWHVLVRASQARNLKLRALAEQMVADPDGPDAYPEKRPSHPQS
jgi:AmiR/NasT family two-component response regulator